MSDVSDQATTDLDSREPLIGSPSTNGHRSAEATAALAAADRRGRRRWPGILAGAVVGGAAVWATTTWLASRDAETTADEQAPSLATAGVERRDLQEEVEWSGTLGYGATVEVVGSGGVVTATSEPGSTLARGEVVIEIDDQPAVLLYGSTPMWRDLSEGDDGIDVLQLEANLAALGYDPDNTVDIDGEFTANTAAMVERWQTDLGREATGAVALGDVVIIEGPSTLVSSAELGSTASGAVATLAPRRTVTDLVGTIDGTVTGLAPIGTVVAGGTILFHIDELPVVAIEPSDAVAAVLTSPTFTTAELEEALGATGHDPDREMTVDGVVTAATEAAMERWQAAAGVPVTGSTDPGQYLPVPVGPQVVDDRLVTEGANLITGGPILTTTVSRLSIAVEVEVGEADEFELGQVVTIELADESTADGAVAEIGAVTPADDPQGTPTVTITIGVVGGDDGSLVEGPVTVVSVGEEILGATVVPVRALVALAEGGFAVEKVVDGTPTLVAVELGSFDDGMVEVVDGDLTPGDEVVVPR